MAGGVVIDTRDHLKTLEKYQYNVKKIMGKPTETGNTKNVLIILI